MSQIHQTINIHPKSSITSSLWTLFGGHEPERIATRFNKKEYVVVLDERGPFFEVWSTDDEGELLELQQTLRPVTEETIRACEEAVKDFKF